MALFLLLVTGICSIGAARTRTVQRGYTSPLVPAEWREIISKKMNSISPTIMVDQKEIRPTGASCYVSPEMQVMIPLSMLKKAFQALAVVTEDEVIHLVRGNHHVAVDLQTDEVRMDSGERIMASCAVWSSNEYYVSAELLKEGLELKAQFDPETGSVSFETDEKYLPDAFSLSEVKRMPEVMDQGKLGTCWAFSSLSALESALLPGNSYRFSRDHLVLTTGNGSYEVSGEARMALSYFLSWQGPVSDPSDSYGDGVTDTALSAAVHVQDVLYMEEPSVEKLKECVFYHGAAEASLYLCMADSEGLQNVNRFYNEKTHAYCCREEKEVNHDVVIVGWDDDYPKEGFVSGNGLPGDGAFLCMNSWGRSFGESGLFWVSYYDACFAKSAMCITNAESRDNYRHIYQSDLRGSTASAGYGNDTACFAAVYEADADEYLEAAGFYTLGDDTSYELYYIPQFTDERTLSRGILMKTGTIEDAGFHTIRFPEAKRVSEGQKFAVMVKITTPGLSYPVAVEKKTAGVRNVDLSDGEGYLSQNGVLFRNTEESSESNICLKVYAR